MQKHTDKVFNNRAEPPKNREKKKDRLLYESGLLYFFAVS